MQQIINFILRNKTTLLYLFLLVIGLAFSIQSHSYHSSRFFNSANRLAGSIYNAEAGISSYFHLKEENEKLVRDNTRLRNLLFNAGIEEADSSLIRSLSYTIIPAEVIKNS